MRTMSAVLLLWLLYQNRVTRGGISSRDAVFDPGLGVTPENSVVNGADTSTDASVAWVALSPKKYVAPLLVKTREPNAEMRIFCGELTTKTSTDVSSRVALLGTSKAFWVARGIARLTWSALSVYKKRRWRLLDRATPIPKTVPAGIAPAQPSRRERLCPICTGSDILRTCLSGSDSHT
jgi:hypothetical protein